MIRDDRSSAHTAGGSFESFDIEAMARAPSLLETVAVKLRDAILSDRLRPGQRLVEQKLAAHFGIGQPTLREALHELEAQGFVRKSQKTGTYVTDLSAEEYRQTHDVRMTLESLAMERAAPNVTAEAPRNLEQSLNQLAATVREPDLTLYHKSDMDGWQPVCVPTCWPQSTNAGPFSKAGVRSDRYAEVCFRRLL